MHTYISTEHRKVLLVGATLLVAFGLLFAIAPIAHADQDPGGCSVNAVGLGIAVYESDGTTPVPGAVTPGETIKYEATLFHSGLASHCNFGGGSGTMTITTPDGIPHDVTGGGIPLVSSGAPFTSAQVIYVVDAADEVGDLITADAAYTGGISHTGVEHSNASAGADISVPFENPGNIIVIKQTDPDQSDQSFEFEPSWTSNFFLQDDEQEDSGPLDPGVYDVSEIVPSGWDQTSATCDDQSPINAIDLEAGEMVTCTFENTQRAHIIIEKNAVPDSDTEFLFDNNFGNGNLAQFGLTDDDQIGLPSYDAEVLPGNYTVTENVPAGWQLDSAACDNGDSPDDITVAPGETVTCTFTNEELATIILVKNTTGGDGAFDFVMTGVGLPANDTLTTVGNTDSEVYSDLDPDNTYTIAETVPDGWDLTSATCDNGDLIDNITPNAGEVITCTFENEQEGKIIVKKLTDPDDSQDQFTFSGDVGGDIGHNGMLMLDVDPGQYSSTETVPAGWDLTDISCDDGNSSGDLGQATATFNVEAGETVTCTFTNTQRGTIIVIKDTVPDDATDFEFTSNTLNAPFFLDDDADGTLSNTETFNNLVPGVYDVAETPNPDYSTQASCDDGSDPSSIGLDAGETVTCTFTNTIEPGKIIIEKLLVPSDAGETFDFTGDVSGTLGHGDTEMQDVAPGQYSSTETPVAGWDLTDITCDDGNSSGDTGSGVATFNVEPGEIVTCTFTNTQQTGNIIVDKVTDPANDPTDFTFDPSWTDDFLLADQDAPHDSGPLTPGQYSVSEIDVPFGWEITNVTCNDDDGDDNTNIVLDPGETVTCTFTNTQLPGRIIVEKQTDPDGDLTLFDFTATWGDFSLADDGQEDSGDLEPGVYSVSETVPDGWDLTSATCDDQSDPSSIDLSAGETVTCVFTNTIEFQGCTLTQGYWKTHSEEGPAAHPDDTWDEVGGPNAEFLNSGMTWLEVFNTSPKGGNVWYQLAHQWMAAYLNSLNDASVPSDVADALAGGQTWLENNDPDSKPKGKDNPEAAEWASLLADYNEGIIGPGHCGDEEEEPEIII